MRNTFISTIALASQLAAASFGCAIIAAPALSAQTADQTLNARKADRQLMQKIRKTVVADKSLSTVKSDDEKKNIEDKATELAGQGKVTSELTVAPSK